MLRWLSVAGLSRREGVGGCERLGWGARGWEWDLEWCARGLGWEGLGVGFGKHGGERVWVGREWEGVGGSGRSEKGTVGGGRGGGRNGWEEVGVGRRGVEGRGRRCGARLVMARGEVVWGGTVASRGSGGEQGCRRRGASEYAKVKEMQCVYLCTLVMDTQYPEASREETTELHIV